jgi:hypothetical protein
VRALYAYAGAGLAVAAGLMIAVAARPHRTENVNAAPQAVADNTVAVQSPTPLPTPAPAPVEHLAYTGRIDHYVIKTDWKELAEALPAEADATSYYVSQTAPMAQTGQAIDAAAHPAALPIDIGDEAPPEATGDTRVGD